jgi:hypothetical protein
MLSGSCFERIEREIKRNIEKHTGIEKRGIERNRNK